VRGSSHRQQFSRHLDDIGRQTYSQTEPGFLLHASVQFWIAFHASHASPVLPLKLLSSLSMYTLKFDVSPHVITAVEWLSTLRGMTALIKSRDSYQVIAESVYRLCFPLVSIGNKHIAKKAAKINPPAA